MTKRFPDVFSLSKLVMVAVVAMVVFGSPGSVRAADNVKLAIEILDGGAGHSSGMDAKEFATAHIGAIAKGIFWAKVFMRGETGIDLYCPPKSLSITTDQYVSILRKYVEKRPSIMLAEEVIPTGLGMVRALKEAFPCK